MRISCPICRGTDGLHKMDCQNADYMHGEIDFLEARIVVLMDRIEMLMLELQAEEIEYE